MSPEGDAASLVICEFDIHSADGHHYVENLKAQFTFNGSEGEPDIVAWAPFMLRQVNAIDVEHQNSSTVSGNAGVSYIGHMSVGRSSNRQFRYCQTVFEKHEINPHYNGRELRTDRITYNISRNPLLKASA